MDGRNVTAQIKSSWREFYPADGNGHGKGIICPICGSGSGPNGTGISEKKGSSSHFLTLQFNWVNNPGGNGMRDLYLWFYVKNIGLPFIILVLALFEKNSKWRRIFAMALPIILAGECIRFLPNIYDNNKLLYLAWLLCCMIVADWCRQIWQKLKGLRARPVIAALAAVTFFLSAGLT